MTRHRIDLFSGVVVAGPEGAHAMAELQPHRREPIGCQDPCLYPPLTVPAMICTKNC